MENLETELKQLIIDTLELNWIVPTDIVSEAPLFGAGLGLDSIDALELGVAIRKKYDIHINTDSSELVNFFVSVRSLAGFVESQLKQKTI